ncbi:TetR/AcrR family transcriptional regulator [Actinacidiphila bryophytorum]|uniref:Transcriptional regulator, TetR family n=1 Tax=Actinacidiphila bryophytorum TaxID=1436133 RepID=A0A9W4H792_9ACTN|nr:TetR/AcrR family transcriptional regulator [Actinacidiphila bryophytorum]MBM9437566.1 TetR/AcrR family transcriptional regulator [Actinacidiphila bryophytorum]MBN6542408.1 TetR/AcrR family transcriptional regulator [Actinacidiphila bryophytorum]CAG7655915.1 Transcriptional regulator, TetR family [Actinacidiphila bryophytorum]
MTGHARPKAPATPSGPAVASEQDPPARPLRRDAVRNHQLVVEAAREVFAEFGTDASMELIASRAGVGVGTVYRRFPNKEALVDEIAGLMLRELTEVARRSLALPDGTGLERFLYVIGRSLAEHRGYADKLVGHSKAADVELLRDRIAELLVQAQESGRVAAGVELGDIMALVWGLRGIVETSGAVVPDAWKRQLDLQLAGLRAAAVPDGIPPAVTRAQLRLIGTGRREAEAGQ